MIDQFILHDQALLTWVINNMSPLLVGRNLQVLYSSSRKGFAEVTSGQLANNDTLTLPRISITRLGHVHDPSRYNSNRIRRLGWCTDDGDVQKRIKSAKHPSPVNINYQVDMWARFVWEMNLMEQKILTEFDPDSIYLTIRPDDVWGNKDYIVFLDGGIDDNSDLEPAERERQIRKTFSLRAEARLYDQSYIPANVVKQFEIQYRSPDDTLLDVQFLPPKEAFGVGDSVETTFTGVLSRLPILEHTILVQAVIGGNTTVANDDGNGNLSGPAISSGSIDYTTGDVSITFNIAPDDTEDVFATYFRDLS